MTSYKDLYLLLSDALNKAMEDLNEQNYGLAAQRLAQAQSQCEEQIYDLEE